MSNNYDLIIFDFDGTLVNTKNSIKKTLQYVINKKYPNITESSIIQCIDKGLTLEDTFITLVPILSIDEVEKFVLDYREKYNSGFGNEHCFLYPNVIETLKKIHSMGIKVVISSNKGEQAILNAVKHFDILKYTTLIVGQVKGVKKKPYKDSYFDLIKPKINSVTKENRVLVVGDTNIDITYAKNIDAHSVFVTYGFGSVDSLTYHPSFIISDIEQLLSIVN